jgi:putative NIF3 family GTP cyclohydrolase 1 type 2
VLKTGASFCGGGASHAEKYVLGGGIADVIITSDMPHHVILETVESGKCVILITHYSAENYGFKKYFEKIKKQTEKNVDCYFYSDKRFM